VQPLTSTTTPWAPGLGAEAAGQAFAEGRKQARAIVDRCSDPERLALARAVVHRLVSAWWRSLAGDHVRAFRLRSPFFTLESLPSAAPTSAFAETLGEAAASLPPHLAAYQIGLLYTALLPPGHRSVLGIYYTPPALAERLISQATSAGVDWSRCRVLDPACGGGAFLTPVALRMMTELRTCNSRLVVENIATRLRGYEIDPVGAWLSQVSLDAVLLPLCRECDARMPLVVVLCDSLRQPPPREPFDLVIGNPPYGRVRLDPGQRVRFKRSLFGHANVYGLFTDFALHQVKTGGVVAYVTPTSFLAGEYFKNLRTLLVADAPPTAIDFVAVRKGIFEDVLQETLLATYRKGAFPGLVDVHEIKVPNGGKLSLHRAGAFGLPADPSRPWLLPRNPRQSSLVGALACMRHRLQDWGYSVSTGPLVWNRHKDQLVHLPGPNRFPLIWAEAVGSHGNFAWKASKKNHAPYFEARAGDDWLLVDCPCVLVQRTTAKEQHRRLIAASLPASLIRKHGAVVIENHLNMVRPTTRRPAVPAGALAAFLNSAAADRAFRCVSGSVAVSAYELEALPLPAPQKLRELVKLVRGKASRNEMEVACARLFGEGPFVS
jgi:adenine-specific DNA-methyltransferase